MTTATARQLRTQIALAHANNKIPDPAYLADLRSEHLAVLLAEKIQHYADAAGVKGVRLRPAQVKDLCSLLKSLAV